MEVRTWFVLPTAYRKAFCQDAVCTCWIRLSPQPFALGVSFALGWAGR